MMLNWWAIALASIAGMAVGALWFSRLLLGRAWAKSVGVPLGSAPTWAYPLALLATFVTAVVLDAAAVVVHAAFGGSFLGVAVVTGIIAWAGFTAARSAVEYLFEQRSRTLFAIDMGHQLAVIAVMSVIIGLFGN